MNRKNICHLAAAARRHPLAAVCVLVEAVIVLALAASLFAPVSTLEIPLEEFLAKNPSDRVQLQEGMLQISTEGGQQGIDEVLSGELPTVRSAGHPLRPGAYLVTVRYTADSTSYETKAASVTMTGSRITNLLYADELILDGAHTSVTRRAWVPFGANLSDFVLQISPSGQCSVQIQSVTLKEQPIYRVMRLLGILLLFAVVDGAFALLAAGVGEKNPLRRRFRAGGLLAVFCVMACLPFFHSALRSGDDLSFHLARIAYLAEELQNGQLPVRLFTGMLNGYGYGSPLYYCDLFLYLPALLYNCMLPLQFCYQIYGVLTTVVTALVCHYSLYRICRQADISAVCTGVYLLSSYRLCNVYERAAVGEYTAMVFLPLVLCGVVAVYRAEKPTLRDGVPLLIGMTGLALCHLLSLEMVGLFLLGFALAKLRKTLQPERFGVLLRAAVLSIGLSAWFLVPMIQSMLTLQVTVSDRYVDDFQNRGSSLFEMAAPIPTLVTVRNGIRGMLGLGVLLAIGIALLAVLLRRSLCHTQGEHVKILLGALGTGGITVLFAWNFFPWNILFSWAPQGAFQKLLGTIQFPWRFLSLGTALFCLAGCAALTLLQQRRAYYKAGMVLLLAGSLLYAGLFYSFIGGEQSSDLTVYSHSYEDGLQLGAGEEYLLPGEVDYNFTRPISQQDALLVKWYDKTDGVAHITLENTGTEPSEVVFPIYNYGNYCAMDEQGQVWPLSATDNSLLCLTVPGGYTGAISVQYREPVLWRLAEGVSLATALGLLVWAWRRKKQSSQKLAGNLAG